MPHICGSKCGRPPATSASAAWCWHRRKLPGLSRRLIPTTPACARLTADRDDDLLVGVLDEVIYPLDTAGESPVDLDINGTDGGVDVTVAMADASTLP